jgi:hypothetical protein
MIVHNLRFYSIGTRLDGFTSAVSLGLNFLECLINFSFGKDFFLANLFSTTLAKPVQFYYSKSLFSRSDYSSLVFLIHYVSSALHYKSVSSITTSPICINAPASHPGSFALGLFPQISSIQENRKNSTIFLLDTKNSSVKDYQSSVYLGHHPIDNVEKLDFILPGSLPFEKNNHYFSISGDLKKQGFISIPPGESRGDHHFFQAFWNFFGPWWEFGFEEFPDSSNRFLDFFSLLTFDWNLEKKNSFFCNKLLISNYFLSFSSEDNYLSDTISFFSKNLALASTRFSVSRKNFF